MNQAQETRGESKPVKTKRRTHETETSLRERVEKVRDLAETVREKVEVVSREKPYVLPLAAGAVGVGVGMLLGSKVVRVVALAAVGSMLDEAFGGEIKRISRNVLHEVQRQLENQEA